MDIHGIFYVSKAQMIEKLAEEETPAEPMETQSSTTGADNNAANGRDGPSTEVQCDLAITSSKYLLKCK